MTARLMTGFKLWDVVKAPFPYTDRPVRQYRPAMRRVVEQEGGCIVWGGAVAKTAGLAFHAPLGAQVEKGMPLYTVHAESKGELAYALDYVASHPGVIRLEADA
ncbi:MAG: hypothetical protein ACOY15_14735 [Pseudomonadota bacterium]